MDYPSNLLGMIFALATVLLRLFSVVLIVYVVISWLYAFQVIGRNAFISSVWEFCRRVTDPVLKPFRRLIPPIAGVDLSVLVVLLLIWMLEIYLLPWLFFLIAGGR
jgi:YggT family protein